MQNPASRNGRAILWTRQDIRSLDELKANGVIRIQRHHLVEKFDLIADYIIGLYSWFVQVASRRVPKPEGVEFPVWCSVSEENMLRPTEDTVVYVLEVDESEVIYFDGSKWDHVLNHIYIPKDAADEARYRAEMARRGHDNLFAFFDTATAHFYTRERKEVMDSWPRVFDIDEWSIFKVQGNLWEIRPDMIREILFADGTRQVYSDGYRPA